MSNLKDKSAIVGIGEGELSPETAGNRASLALETIKAAADEAGLDVKDIDGIVRYTIDASASDQILAGNLGLKNLSYAAEIPYLGGSACAAVATAAASVMAGLANYVVCYRASTAFDFGDGARHSSSTIWSRDAGAAEFLRPYGFMSMMDVFALIYERHCYKYGTTSDQIAAIPIAARKHAARNPRAFLRDQPLTIEDYRNSPTVTGRLKEADVGCGRPGGRACACIVTSVERARDLKQTPARIMAAATGEGHDCPMIWEMWPLRQEPTEMASKYVAQRLFNMAGVTPKDIDVAEIYDCCSIHVLIQIEDYGFCKKGDGGSFVQDGRIELGGEIPIITHGGTLAFGGVHGFDHVLEGVRQVRGTSTAQVEDAELVLVTSSAPVPTGALILRR
jgi:acetyl-CoA acetyltransferase